MLTNHVRLMGCLGQDATVRSFQHGGEMVALNVATTDRWTDKATGERKEHTDWHKVSILTPNDVRRAKDLRKGDWIEVDGKLATRSYEKTGVRHFVTEVVVRGPGHRLLVLPRPKPRPDDGYGERPPEFGKEPAGGQTDPDDDVPF
ncbi:single-strand DNA-binding protein [Sphingomonas sp. YR710]|uniref:single-stranded DNA-binding protein n=1 Tax=Sphingomonas sp. YR710 TaxID=1882773 RepID=UPI00088641A7|nr:single-stranded DNA-binding protein [Sphingomonas sp. YR710]SDC30456.1 single-strand DNA-binding protein [Sphingomonas sp. YR710]